MKPEGISHTSPVLSDSPLDLQINKYYSNGDEIYFIHIMPVRFVINISNEFVYLNRELNPGLLTSVLPITPSRFKYQDNLILYYMNCSAFRKC